MGSLNVRSLGVVLSQWQSATNATDC